MFHPGDDFWCNAEVCNSEGMPLEDYPVFVILDIHGLYLFAPGFTPFFDNYLDELPVIPEGMTEIAVIEPFRWPRFLGSNYGIFFYGAILNPQTSQIVGDMGAFEFGWTR